MTITVGEIAKAITALVGAAGEALTLGLVTGSAAKWVTIAIALVTALAVYLVPNSSGATLKTSSPAQTPPVTPPPKP